MAGARLEILVIAAVLLRHILGGVVSGWPSPFAGAGWCSGDHRLGRPGAVIGPRHTEGLAPSPPLPRKPPLPEGLLRLVQQ